MLKRLHQVITPPIGETAPAMICVLAQHIIAYRDRCFDVQDYAAAIENMLLAIESLGYASCWIEGHITDTDRQTNGQYPWRAAGYGAGVLSAGWQGC